MRRAVFPGSFDPATIAHLAIADAALEQCRCDHLTFVLSRSALGKTDREHSLGRRAGALAELLADRRDLGIEIVDARLIADIAAGFDVVVVGADKWSQILDPQWYESAEEYAACLDRLPEVALVPRPPTRFDRHPSVPTTVLSLSDARLADVSSTAVRAGRTDWAATKPAVQGDELSGR
jgi:hypothetical protein